MRVVAPFQRDGGAARAAPSAQLERTIAWSDAPYDGGASPASGGRDDAV